MKSLFISGSKPVPRLRQLQCLDPYIFFTLCKGGRESDAASTTVPAAAAAKMREFKPGSFSSSSVQFALKIIFFFKRWSPGNFLFNSCFYSADMYLSSIMPAILH